MEIFFGKCTFILYSSGCAWIFYLSIWFLVIFLIFNCKNDKLIKTINLGIIIDTFGSLRDDKNQLEEDINEHCYICGISSYEFETQ